VRHGIYPGVAGLLVREGFFKYSDIITYPISGAFTEYIINAYGIDKYKMFYKDALKNTIDVFKYHYGMDIGVAEEKFLRFIDNIKTGDVVLNTVENFLKKYELLK
jgi:hypothetical protein